MSEQNYDTFRTLANDSNVKEAERLIRQLMSASTFNESDLKSWVKRYKTEARRG